MTKFLNIAIDGMHGKPIITDIGFNDNDIQKPVLIFLHGFKGFKDWGHFNLLMDFFIQQNFVFIKFNFSFNGGTINQPIDFPDLEAFGNNDYLKELDDVHVILNWIETNRLIPKNEIDLSKIYVIGHSRGGSIAIIKASEDSRIKKLVTWAAVSDFYNRIPSNLNDWKIKKVIYIENTRTHQHMPMYYNFAEVLLRNKERLNIENCEKKINIPHLIIHGIKDEAVHFSEAENLKRWNSNAEIFFLQNANHTFGTNHPFVENNFPKEVEKVLEKTIAFLNT